MCYRFYIDLMNDKEKELREIIRTAEKSLLTDKFRDKLSKPLITSGEVRPTDVAAVIAPGRKRDKAVFPMKWGFSLKGSKQPLVNARVETAATKPTFKNEWLSHRCIVPASWYFEWEHFKSPDSKPEELISYALTDMIYEKA